MVDSRDKGARAETAIKKILREHTGLAWERVPGSGALNEKHKLKGDLYIPGVNNKYAVEVKHYAEDHLTSQILTGANPILLDWWGQAVRQGVQVGKIPLLIFKHDRSKTFVAFHDEIPTDTYRYFCICAKGHNFYTCLLTDFLTEQKPTFII